MDSYYVNLNHRELLVVSGEDSEQFLQGQLTCDLGALSEPDSCPGCLCDNKGRVLASFTLWKLAGTFYLEMEQGVAAIAEQQLKKYGVFYKSEISINSQSFHRAGLIGADTKDFLQKLFPALPIKLNQIVISNNAGESYLRLVDADNQRYELWQNSESGSFIDLDSESNLSEGSKEDWHLLDQRQGLYRLQAGDSGLFTPQELNYDQSGHISFTKGCYTGQEIVARMHYRGKAKKRLYLLKLVAESAPEKQMKISDENGKAVGEIIDVAETSKNQYQIQVIANESVHEDIYIQDLENTELKLISI
jgi:folate-binding protein YgfZ